LFFEEHFERLKLSAQHLNKKMEFDRTKILGQVKRLVTSNQVMDGNVEIIVHFDEKGSAHLILMLIEQRYPDPDQYLNGVDTLTFDSRRINPHIKQINIDLRQKTQKKIAEKNIYELILYNQNNCITEGSRSNIFFIKKNELITSPIELVLPGITRDKVFFICHQHRFPILETNIPLKEIGGFDAAFLTGTSPKLLPLRSIDNIVFNTRNNLMRELMQHYDDMIKSNIDGFKNLLKD
jgi:branched-chain amino acid aminotransferase